MQVFVILVCKNQASNIRFLLSFSSQIFSKNEGLGEKMLEMHLNSPLKTYKNEETPKDPTCKQKTSPKNFQHNIKGNRTQIRSDKQLSSPNFKQIINLHYMSIVLCLKSSMVRLSQCDLVVMVWVTKQPLLRGKAVHIPSFPRRCSKGTLVHSEAPFFHFR